MQVLNRTETCIVRDKEHKIPFNISVNRMRVEIEMCFLAQVPEVASRAFLHFLVFQRVVNG